jgi:hypothetical protein
LTPAVFRIDTDYDSNEDKKMSEYEVLVSLFRSVKDTGRNGFLYGVNGVMEWPFFTEILFTYSKKEFAGKGFAPLFAPTQFKLIPGKSGGYRSLDNATMAGMAVIDADGGLGFDEVVRVLSDYGLEAVLYTTASNQHDDRFRVIVPFAARTNVETQKLGVEAICRFLSPGWRPDTSKNNCYSLFYVPGIYPNAVNRFVHLGGAILPVKAWIEVGGLEDIVDPVIRNRRFVPWQSTESSWSSLNDCPFIKAEWVNDYLSMEDGSYNGLYQFMVRAAAGANARDIALSGFQLADLARDLEMMSGRHHKTWSLATRNLLAEAENALSYASSITPNPEFQSHQTRYPASWSQPDDFYASLYDE